MNKQLIALGIIPVFVSTLCAFNIASAQNTRVQDNNTADPTETVPATTSGKAIGGADAPSARLVAFIRVGANPTVFRSKDVASQVCIQPSVSLNVNSIVPFMSVDFSNSLKHYDILSS